MTKDADASTKPLLLALFDGARERTPGPRTGLGRAWQPAAVAVAAAVFAGTLGAAAAEAQPRTGAERYEITIAPPKAPGSEQTPDEKASGDAAPADSAEGGAAAPEAAELPPDTPLFALQVGAYRKRASAEAMKERLAPEFADTVVADATSGGETIYRVRVGRLPAGPALETQKRRLAEAGYPAFPVRLDP